MPPNSENAKDAGQVIVGGQKYMKKLLGVLSLLVLFGAPLKAQVTPKYQASAGYLFDSYHVTPGNSLHLNGWYGSLDYNPLRYIGAELQLSEGVKDQGLLGNN